VSIVAAMLVAFVDTLEAEPVLAARLARVLGTARPDDERIPLADVVQRGAPSEQWVTRRKLARGPRGARYVLASELAAELAASTIARRKPAAVASNLEDDAHAAVVNLAARRSRRTA
jgi:hypothetical protein